MSTDLYRFYNGAAELLYVGISKSAIARWSQHQAKPWWAEVIATRVEHYATREEARQAELHAIRTEQPRYNIADRLAPGADGAYWMPDDGSGRCCCIRRKAHGVTRTNRARTKQGSSWRCALPADHAGLHRAPASAHQSPWDDPWVASKAVGQ